MRETVRLTIEAGVATITLARPEKLNALDGGMIEALGAIVHRLDHDRSVRVAIITGEGKAFCAGGDIAAWGRLSPVEMGENWVRDGHRVFDHLARLKVPLIAAINGHAFGGGIEIAATADIRLGEEQGRYGMPETAIGMVPGWSGTQRLVKKFGGNLIRRLVLGGEIISAARALEVGLIDELVPTGGALSRALAIADQIKVRGPLARRSPSRSSTPPRAMTLPRRSKFLPVRCSRRPPSAGRAWLRSLRSGRRISGTSTHDRTIRSPGRAAFVRHTRTRGQTNPIQALHCRSQRASWPLRTWHET